MNIRFPNITGRTEMEQLVQVKSYLHQLADQLNFAMTEVENKVSASAVPTKKTKTEQEVEAQETFTSIKSLIIKSADIVEAYSEAIEMQLSGKYVAVSDYGTFTQETNAKISANSENIEANFNKLQKVLTSVESIKETEGYIKAGVVDEVNGDPMYGLEIGQTTTQTTDGGKEDVFKAFARFTSDRLTFFDSYGNQAAWISQNTFNTPNLIIDGLGGTFKIGHLKDIVRSDGSIVTKYVGGV